MLNAITAFEDHVVMGVPILIPKLHGDAVLVQRKQLLPQPVFLLLFPFLGQEVLDGGASAEEGGAVAPDGGRGVGLGDFGGGF